MQEDEQKPANKTSFLSMLLGNGADSTVKLITLAAVVVTGGGNFWATKDAARITDKEAQRAVDQINRLEQHLDSTIQRQKDIYDMLKKLSEEKNNGH
jgi:hypothetical protein